MPTQYIPVFIFAILAAAFPAVTLIVFKFIRPEMRDVGAALKPYECGVPEEGSSRGRYSVRFYQVAILFLVFDIEAAFMYPWTVLYNQLSHTTVMTPGGPLQQVSVFGFVEMLLFVAILVVALAYVWRKKAIGWE